MQAYWLAGPSPRLEFNFKPTQTCIARQQWAPKTHKNAHKYAPIHNELARVTYLARVYDAADHLIARGDLKEQQALL